MLAPDSPLVSVVIAFLNEERFLPEAVESVLRQTYSRWELLLVNDGSADRSTSIATEYAARFPDRIRYCEHEGRRNKGLSASRNHGIRQSQGELIALLDADDVWLPDKLTRQVAVFQSQPGVALLAEASRYWSSWEDAGKSDVVIPVGAPANRVYQPTELLFLLYPFSAGAAPCPSGLMFKKQAFLAVDGFEESFTKDYQLYEDQAFLNKIYLTEPVFISADCNNLYRQRQGSIVQAVKAEGHYDKVRRYFLEWFAAYLAARGEVNARLTKLVARALLPYHRPWVYRAIRLAKRVAGRQ